MSRSRALLGALLASFAVICLVPAGASSADIEAIADGGFETSTCQLGDFGCDNESWSDRNSFSFCMPGECDGRPASGRGWVRFGADAPPNSFTGGSLIQTAPVYVDPFTQPYPRSLSFDLIRGRSATSEVNSSLEVLVGDQSLAFFDDLGSSREGYVSREYTVPPSESGRVEFYFSCFNNSSSTTLPCPSFELDNVALTSDGPAIELVKAPPKTTTSKQARFVFKLVDTASPYQLECRLDRGSFAPCASPKTYRSLKPGKHTFTVRAIGREVPLPQTRTWTVKKKRSRG